MIDHPSYLELDRAALGIEVAASARMHVSACERCQRHIERAGQHEPSQAWVRQLAPAPPVRSARWFGWFAVAAAAAVLLVVFARRDREPSYTAVKGVPTVVVHIKRGDTVFVWNGVEPVKPGDRLRLELAAREYRRVRVLAARGVSLFDGTLPASGSLLLPIAWEVDAQPGTEVLAVVLTDSRGSEWRTTLALHKRLEGIN